MSVQKLRQLKLYQKLQKDLKYRDKLEEKIRQISQTNPSTSSSMISRKLNNNKKYLHQQQKNAQIQRQNLILFQKIQSQGTKNHYHKKIHPRNRSSKTLNQMQDYEPKLNQRKYNNYSQNKVHYQKQQSRISFEENQELMRPKMYSKKQKMVTELTPEVMQIFRSRILESRVESQQNVLFQGIAEIDSIRFKVKISIHNKVYCLSGKNKHTDILLKMQINQYRKFHKQVLLGNPSGIFQYLMIDKGQIKFRTEQELIPASQKQKIYKIEQEDEQNQEVHKRHKQVKRSSNYKNHNESQESNFLQQKYRRQVYANEERIEPATVQIRSNKHIKSSQKLYKKQNIAANSNPKMSNRQQQYQKYRTLEEYINEKGHPQRQDRYKKQYKKHKDQRQHYGKDIRSGQSTQIQTRNMNNRYRLPYL